MFKDKKTQAKDQSKEGLFYNTIIGLKSFTFIFTYDLLDTQSFEYRFTQVTRLGFLSLSRTEIRDHLWETLKSPRGSFKDINNLQIAHMTRSTGHHTSIQGLQSSFSSGRQLGFLT